MGKENWFNQVQEDVLWHYTDVISLKSIISNGLKLFSSTQKNDINESHYGRNIFDRAMCGLYHLMGFDELKAQIKDTDFYKKMTESSFLFSMTTNKDNACFWQTYAKNDEGISIGIKTDLFRNRLKEYIDKIKKSPLEYKGKQIKYPEQRLHFAYCLYNEEDMVVDSLKFVNDFYASTNPPESELFAVQMMFLREEISYRYKHPSFYGENEVRITCWDPWQQEGEENLFFINEMIEEIIISPLVKNPSDIEKQIKNIIGDLRIKISRSQSPLRNLKYWS